MKIELKTWTEEYELILFSVPNPCDSNPCQNMGACLPDFFSDSFVCACAEGFEGIVCENGTGVISW